MDQTSSPHPTDICPNCGQAGMAAYCSQCGEKRRDQEDWKLSRIAGEAIEELTSLERSKLWQTFRLLLFKPGQLTRDYWNGRRKRYLGPVKLYLIFFALTLVLYSIHRPTAVYDVRTFESASTNVPKLFDQLAKERGVPRAQIAEELNSRWQSYISMSQVVYPLFVALALKLLYRRRRLYFAEHLIFALHILSFLYLCSAVFWPIFVLSGIHASVAQYPPAFLVLTAASLVWVSAYLIVAVRRAYSESWVAAILKGGAVFLTYNVTTIVFMSGLFLLAVTITRLGGWFG